MALDHVRGLKITAVASRFKTGRAKLGGDELRGNL
jgi:hypothetical protein